MLTVRYNDISFSLPESFAEVTVGQYLRVTACTTNRDLLAAVASDPDQVKLMPAGSEGDLYARLTFLMELPPIEPLTKARPIAGYSPPKEANLCSLAQKWAFDDWQDEIRESNPDAGFLDIALPILAIYLFPAVSGKPFSSVDDARDILPIIEALPVLDALPLAGFFLTSYNQPTSSGLVSFQHEYRKPWLSRWLPTRFRSWPHTRNWLKLRQSAIAGTLPPTR